MFDSSVCGVTMVLTAGKIASSQAAILARRSPWCSGTNTLGCSASVANAAARELLSPMVRTTHCTTSSPSPITTASFCAAHGVARPCSDAGLRPWGDQLPERRAHAYGHGRFDVGAVGGRRQRGRAHQAWPGWTKIG